ncbi:MAG: ribosomal L7Ae/L30e/S12e/Gadd45 family protein [Patescibacteria group bacterium]
MLEVLRDPAKRVVGFKQTLRVLQQGRAAMVYLATDVDEHIKRKIMAACAEHGVELRSAGLPQRELGTLAQIDVGAAVIATLRA